MIAAKFHNSWGHNAHFILISSCDSFQLFLTQQHYFPRCRCVMTGEFSVERELKDSWWNTDKKKRQSKSLFSQISRFNKKTEITWMFSSDLESDTLKF